MKPRLNVYLDYALLKQLDAFARQNGASKSGVIEAALMSFLSPDSTDRREAAIARRLDRLTRQYARIERAQTVALETLALFVRHHLSTTAPLPASERADALAKGEERFAQFVEQLGRELAKGPSLIDRVVEEATPEADDFFNEEDVEAGHG